MESSSLSPLSSEREITQDWLEQVLSHKLGSAVKIHTWSARSPESREGYLSEISFIRVSFTVSGTPVEERSLVVKFMPQEERVFQFVKTGELGKREVEFYKYSASEEFLTFCRNSGLLHPVPEVYWAESRDDKLTIVLHDLCSNDFKSSSSPEGLTITQIKSTLNAIAIIHGAGIATIREHGKHKVDFPWDSSALKKFVVRGINIQVKMFEGTPTANTLKALLPRVEELIFFHRKHSFIKTLIHGDLWAGNIMLSENGQEASIIDWQLAVLGNPVCDIVTLLLMSSDPSIYNEHLIEVLECYWGSFEQSLRKNGVPVGITLQDLVCNTEALWIHGYMFMTASLETLIGNYVSEEHAQDAIRFLEKRGIFQTFLAET